MYGSNDDHGYALLLISYARPKLNPNYQSGIHACTTVEHLFRPCITSKRGLNMPHTNRCYTQ
eukprot:6207059-Pleurochrysis_carterae.AAC.2